jgi:cytochrome c oxidase cbb3-type subunit I/II
VSNEQEHWHSRIIESRVGLFAVLTTIAILVGGLVEIIPMYTVAANAPKNADLVAPYTPLQLAGRDLYVREGCYNCHSQMIRPMRAETMRYGEWSRAAEYVHDRPFQLGSRRIGPDLHRVGGKYPDAWHYEHMLDPRATSPGSIMPAYSWMFRRTIDPAQVERSLRAIARLDGSYSDADIARAGAWYAEEANAIVARLADAGIEADPDLEIIAMIAYLQRLGTDGAAVINGVAAANDAATGGTP